MLDPSITPAHDGIVRCVTRRTKARNRLCKLFASVFILAGAAVQAASPIPSDRLTDWTPGVSVGVPAGIPTNRTRLIDVTRSPYNADNSGSTDTRAAIQNAINDAQASDVVFLPAGRYRIDAALNIGFQKPNITLRGQGTTTVIDCRTPNFGIQVGTSFEYKSPTSGNTLTPAKLVKGATKLEVQNTSEFGVGLPVMISLGNDPSVPVMSVFGYDNRPLEGQWQGMRRQISRVVAKTTDSLTIFPGLYGNYTGSPNAKVVTVPFHTVGVGIEDLLIDCSNGTTTFPVGFITAYGCWAKNVKVQYSNNYGIYISESLQCEVRHCWIDQAKGQGSTSHAGILMDTAVGCLIEDNVVARNFPSIMISQASCGNVVAYNFCYDSRANGAEGCSINTNHGPHNSFNLYEGNIAPNVQSDGYFGGASHDTIFRNWLHGMEPGMQSPGWTVSLNRFTYYYSLVGNIFGNAQYPADGASLAGNPNMGNGMSTGNGPPWSVACIMGSDRLTQDGNIATSSAPIFNPSHVGWFIHIPRTWSLARIDSYIDSKTVRLANSQKVTDAIYVLSPGPGGYQELDGNVLRTAIRKGNFNYQDKAVPQSEYLSDSDLPPSLYRDSKPSWFGALSWPAINPNATTVAPAYESIPAGYRFVNAGEKPPGLDPTVSGGSTAPTLVRIKRIAQ
jgi:hypothetical protein